MTKSSIFFGNKFNGLSFECFLRVSLKFDSIGYMPYLRQILTSKPQKSSQNTSPYRFTFKFEVKFANFTHRDPYLENVNLNLRRFACKAKQCRHLKSVVGGGGLKGVGSDFAI